MDILEKIPIVSEEKEFFLKESIHLLEELNHPLLAHHAYRALLRIVLFRGELNRYLPNNDNSCDLDLIELMGKMESVNLLFLQVISDAKLAFPKDKSRLEASQIQFQNLLLDFQSGIKAQGSIALKSALEGEFSADPNKSDWGCSK